jgi:diacylglycerol kinase (ATP)
VSISIIINPIAGGFSGGVGERVDLASRVAAQFGESADVSVTREPGHARALAAAARESGARLVVAWGGDGTVNEIASELAFTGIPIGIVPGGSGNGLARELALAAPPARALADALSGHVRTIDAGEFGGRFFVNVAGIGFDAYVAARFNTGGINRRGMAGYVRWIARALIDYELEPFAITTHGTTIAPRALIVVLANGTQYGNGMRIAPGARCDDGVLDLVVVEEWSRWATVARLPWAVAGAVHRVPRWSSRHVTEARFESDRPILFHVDGEPVQGGTRLDGRIHPGALKIAVANP